MTIVFRIGRTSLLLFLVAVLGVGSAYAQGFQRPSPEEMRERMTERMENLMSQLDLEETQTDTVRAILMGSVDQRIKLMEENRGQRRAMRDAMDTIAEETKTLLSGVLSEEQMKTYESLAERTNRRRGPRGDGRNGNN